MLINSKTIHFRSLKLALAPIVALTLLLTTALTTLYLYQLDRLSLERGYHTSRLLSQLAYQSMHNRLLLQSMVNTSVSGSEVNVLRIYDLNREPLVHAGPHFAGFNQIDPAAFGLEPTHLQRSGSNIFIVPIHADHDSFAPFGWLVVEISQVRYALLEYQTLFIAILLGLACAIFSAFFTRKFCLQVQHSLTNLKGGLVTLRKGGLDVQLDASGVAEIDEATDGFNALAYSLKSTQEDVQRNIDQSIEDLRETLETIEIQNIELDLARKEAVEASRVKSDFLANTSHEIRTPLNGIIGFTSLLLKTELGEQQKEYLRTIQNSSQGLLTIINDVLDFSKIESGKLQLDYVPMELREIIEESLQIMAPAAHEKSIQLILFVDKELPLRLLGDPLRLKQVLTNLVSNAIKFSNTGNVIIKANLTIVEESQIEVSISVEDSGIGIKEKDKQKLFNAFSQLDTSNSRKHGGTGLGLAVSKGLVKRMNGEIGVRNSESGGATFWFTAKFGIETQDAPAKTQALLSGCHFALLSTNISLTAQVEEILESEDGTLHQVRNLTDVLALIKEKSAQNQPIEALFLDFDSQQARNIEGAVLRDLCSQLSKHFNCRTIIFCTPAIRRLLSREITEQQACYHEKPLGQKRLLNFLRKALEVEIRPEDQDHRLKNYDNKPRILAVDDNPANLQLVGELLHGLGAEVTLASDGKQAIDITDQQPFDLIFMDLQMPIMDGIEATKIIRNRESGKRRTPIVALTAHAMAEQKSQLLLAGMDDYLSKPVSETQLAHVINRWLKARKQYKAIEAPTPSIPPKDKDNSSVKVVDIYKSLQLTNNKPSLAKDMLTMLLASLGSDLSTILSSHAASDFDLLETTVHRLHGGCCYCGVERLRQIAYETDKSLQAKNHTNLDKQIKKLKSEIEILLDWAEDHDVDTLFDTEEPVAQ